VQNYKLIKEILRARANYLKEFSYILNESIKTLKKLRYPIRDDRLIKAAVAMFLFPEPVITEIMGAIILLSSFKGFKRIDERIFEEILILEYKIKTNFIK